jgi:hypothetical protein
MTVKEFYDWAVENKIENREILMYCGIDGLFPFDANCDITISKEGLEIVG